MAGKRISKQQLSDALRQLPLPVQEHAKRCRMIAIYLVDKLRREDWFIEGKHNPDYLVSAVQLHDIGKTRIPLDNLYAEHNESARKKALYRSHVEEGVSILEQATGAEASAFTPRSFERCLCQAITEHHEHIDGCGFPKGLSGQGISLAGRLTAVANALDHLAFVGATEAPDPAGVEAALQGMAGNELDADLVAALLADKEGFEHFLEYVRERAAGGKGKTADGYGICLRFSGIYNIQENRVVDHYCEYLLNDPYYGLLRPEVFLAVAEKTGQILKLLKLTLRHLCLTVDAVADKWEEYPLVSLPIPASCLESKTFIPEACRLLKAYGIKRGSICLVLDEYSVTQSLEAFQAAVMALREGGFRVGAHCLGDSSTLLSVLDSLPLDALYVDGRYTGKIVQSPNAYGVASGLLDVAHNLHMRMVFFGVDSRKIEGELLKMTARYATGALYGEPLRERDFIAGYGGGES